MEASGLQIGDYLLGQPDNKIVRVVELKENDIVCNQRCYDLQPIPITPEILKANGFVRVGEEWNRLYRLEFSNDTTDPNSVTADYESFTVDYNFLNENLHVSNKLLCTTMGISFYNPVCKYVHELQHILRLCRIDKDFEL